MPGAREAAEMIPLPKGVWANSRLATANDIHAGGYVKASIRAKRQEIADSQVRLKTSSAMSIFVIQQQ